MSHDPRSEAPAQEPAAELAEVWDLLDALPRPASSVDMAATTIDMVAAAVDAAERRGAGSSAAASGRRWPIRWLSPAAVVAASLVAGVVVGRATAPDPEERVLENLPLVRHLGLLREAGSMAFLEAFGDRGAAMPPRLPPDAARDGRREFDEAIHDLETDHALGAEARPLMAQRRDALAGLSRAEQEELERSVQEYSALSATQRRDLKRVAEALADPRRQSIRDAARAWHLWIAASDPPDRRNIVELDDEERLEWIDRRARFRDWERGDRRGPPPDPDAPPPRGPGQNGGPGPGRPRGPGPRGEGIPRGDRGPRPGEPGGDRPPSVRPGSPPPETQAVPR